MLVPSLTPEIVIWPLDIQLTTTVFPATIAAVVVIVSVLLIRLPFLVPSVVGVPIVAHAGASRQNEMKSARNARFMSVRR